MRTGDQLTWEGTALPMYETPDNHCVAYVEDRRGDGILVRFDADDGPGPHPMMALAGRRVRFQLTVVDEPAPRQ
jgi:hypothetical protein